MMIQESFLKGWRDSYVRMTDDAYAGIAEALFKDMPPVPIPEHPSEKNIVRRGLSTAFKDVDDDFWREFDIQDATSWVTAQKLSKSWVKEHPECAPKHEGLRALLSKLSVVGFTAEKCTDRWLLRVLEDFRGIYAKDPGMCDYDAMVEFLTLEGLMKEKEDPELFAAIPREDCEALDLRLSKNLKPWLERYSIAVAKGPDAPITEMESDGITVDYTHDFPERVTLGADGAYRWRYDRDAHQAPAPTKMFWRNLATSFLLVFIILVLLLGLPFIVLPRDFSASLFELIHPALFFGYVVLVFCGGTSFLAAGVTHLIHYRKRSFRYKLTEEGVWFMSTPDALKAKANSETADLLFRRIKGAVYFMPSCNLIVLGRLGEPLFIPPEDYPTIQDFIKQHIPPIVKIVED